MTIPAKTIERLCAYRRVLFSWLLKGKNKFFSHELAAEANVTPAQLRRDLMSLNTIGTPKHGYLTANIVEELGLIIEGESGQKMVLVGAGNLGKAILEYFVNRRPDLKIVAAFDSDPAKVGKSFSGCPCLALEHLARVIQETHASIGIVTVPGEVAQTTANSLVAAGIHSLVNFAPTSIKVPDGVHVEDLDISISLEKAAYFARVHEEGPGFQGKPLRQKKGDKMRKILCIEDDQDIVESYKAILKTAGYEVAAAYDGESGYAKAREFEPDLIILDVMMKDTTEGFHVAYKFRQDPAFKYVPILMLTSVNSESGFNFNKEKDGAYLPVDAFVEKPVAPNSLLLTVRKLLSLSKEQINVEGVV
ncbi:MAG: redox-sensing transcriptional repressor Rex [Oligoflexia bacterium]|nr:redox-sensing transcriptional repressor Rex [Oligoflexia bacterium]